MPSGWNTQLIAVPYDYPSMAALARQRSLQTQVGATAHKLADRYRAVRYAPEVIDVVSFGESPTIVSDAVIAELRGWAGEALDIITIQPGFRPGDLVDITDGPMRGLQAVILHDRNDRDRVTVLLSILECGAQMMISRSQLARAG